MHKNHFGFFCLAFYFLLLLGCTRDPLTDSLLGTTWVPVHASGGYDSEGYKITWDGDVDQNGILTVSYQRNGETIEYPMTFSGYKFYKVGKEKVFTTFTPPNSETISYTPHRYYIKDDRIYLERSASSGTPWSSSVNEDESETRFVSFLLVEFTTDRMTFDGVTYRRKE